MDVVSFVAGFGVGFAALGLALFFFWFLKPWIRSILSGGKISLFQIVAMRLRGSPINTIVDAYLAFVQKGQPRKFREIESHYIANQHKIHNAGDLIQSLEESDSQ